MAVNSGNGWIKFSIGGQYLIWNTGVANVFTSDPVDGDGARLTGEALAAVAVEEGDQVGDGYDTTYWTFGEGPVECVLCTNDNAVIYNGTPYFKAEGGLVTVHPTQDQVESGSIGDGINHEDYVTDDGLAQELLSYLELPILGNAVQITGAQGTDDTAILVSLLAALDELRLIDNQTSMVATATAALTLSMTGTAADGT